MKYIDDFLHAGENEFHMIMAKLRERFLAGKLEEGQFGYVGFKIKQYPDKIRHLLSLSLLIIIISNLI